MDRIGERSRINIRVTNMKSRQHDMEAAVWLLEQIAIEAGHDTDRSRVRRAVDEASALWTTEDGDRWWRWIADASRTLGLKSKVIDCTLEQLTQISRDGGQMIVSAGDQSRWAAIQSSNGRRYPVLSTADNHRKSLLSEKKLREFLGGAGRRDTIRCVVIEPNLGPAPVADDHHEVSPLSRFLAILRPEWPDIWLLIVFAVVTGILALATPLAVESLVNTVAFGRLLQPIVILALLLLAFLAFSAALQALKTYVVEIIQRRLFARVAADLAFRLPRVDIPSLDGVSGRELVNRFFEIVTLQKVSAQLLLDGISLVMGALIGMAVLAFYHPWLLGFDIVLLAMIGVTIFVLGRGAVSTSIKESKAKYAMASWLEDLIGCQNTFRLGGAAEFALAKADSLIYNYLNYRRAHFNILMRQVVFALGLEAVASTALLGLGGWLVVSGQLTLGQLVAAELIVTVIVGSFAKLGKHMEGYYDVMASVDKLGHLFDLKIEHQDGLVISPPNEPAEVSINGVCLQDWMGRTVVDHLHLKIEGGDRMMLQGPSGSGKSHLLDMLYGSRDPVAGHVTLNGFDPRDLRPDALRQQVALVRNIETFHGTIAENIHLERPDISIHAVREAIELVGLSETILEFPDGLETELTERGFPLTPNQARKLMIARAIVGRPSLLLVDGLVDSLPDDEGRKMTAMLADPLQNWTLVMVTNRSDLARLGNRIHMLRSSRKPSTQERINAG